MRTPDPRLDPTDEASALEALLARSPGYLPGFAPEPGSPGHALLAIVARYREVLARRLDRLPDKDALAFLDLMGESPVGPRAARAPVVFRFEPPSAPALPDAVLAAMAAMGVPAPAATPVPPVAVRVPAGTSVAAPPAGGGEPITFETEQDIGLAAGPLAQACSLVPGRDGYADHTADLAAGRPFAAFAADATTPHLLYLGHDTLLALNGRVAIEVEFRLASPGNRPLALIWEYYDGKAWRPFGEPDLIGAPDATVDGTLGLTRSGVVTLRSDNARGKPTTVAGVGTNWIRARAAAPLIPDAGRVDARVDRVRVGVDSGRLLDPALGFEPTFDAARPFAGFAEAVRKDPGRGLRPDLALAQGAPADVTKPFGPFGPTPAQGADFAFSSEEVFSKPGADVLLLVVADPPADPQASPSATLAWEFWDGLGWAPLPVELRQGDGGRGARFDGPALFAFRVPDSAIPRSRLQNQDGRWVRVRVDSGDFSVANVVKVPIKDDQTATLTFTTNVTPLIRDLRLSYVHSPGRQAPAACVSVNDFAEAAHPDASATPFVPFRAVADRTAALYLGFGQPPPADFVSLYFQAEPAAAAARRPPLAWEAWDGDAWVELATRDDTSDLSRAGMLAIVGLGGGPGSRLARFGRPLWWVRGRMRDDAEPPPCVLRGIHLNAVWASQSQTVRDEVLGSGSGEPSQGFNALRPPVLEGEAVEVRELEGLRAAVELPTLAREVPADRLRVVSDPRGRPREVWVRWEGRESPYGIAPGERAYVVERTRGRIVFGAGRPLPPGRDNVLLRSYRTGGGASGNVPAGAISQLLAGLPFVPGVTNPVAAEAGADGETMAEVRARGPGSLRDRGRAVSASDYEALAREASPAVAVARVVPGPTSSAPGAVTLMIMPRSRDPRPRPSDGLARLVRDYVRARTPAELAGLAVVGPSYWNVGANVAFAPVDPTASGPVALAVGEALAGFLHPLTGGPEGRGWPPGRAVHLSDASAVVEAVPGVDHAVTLELTRDGIPQGGSVEVPADRVVVAGEIRVLVAAGPRPR